MFINRNWTRTEHDDFVLNIQSKLSDSIWATPIHIHGTLMGWELMGAYE